MKSKSNKPPGKFSHLSNAQQQQLSNIQQPVLNNPSNNLSNNLIQPSQLQPNFSNAQSAQFQSLFGQQAPIQQFPIPIAPGQIQPNFTNAQVAQFQSSPQLIPQQPVQQQPQKFNSLFGYPVSVPPSGVGYYGFGTRDISVPQE